MERILSGEEKIRKAEEIYYRRKRGIPRSRFSKQEDERKRYLGSKILLQILIIVNLIVIIIGIQNKEYVFTSQFLKDIENYNINISKSIKEFIGINIEEKIENSDNSNIEEKDTVNNEQNNNQENITEEIVPNEEGQASSLNEMDEDIAKIEEITTFKNPINEGIITSRFGTRESINKNVEGYHTGIDISAEKGTSIYSAISRKSNISV